MAAAAGSIWSALRREPPAAMPPSVARRLSLCSGAVLTSRAAAGSSAFAVRMVAAAGHTVAAVQGASHPDLKPNRRPLQPRLARRATLCRACASSAPGRSNPSATTVAGRCSRSVASSCRSAMAPRSSKTTGVASGLATGSVFRSSHRVSSTPRTTIRRGRKPIGPKRQLCRLQFHGTFVTASASLRRLPRRISRSADRRDACSVARRS